MPISKIHAAFAKMLLPQVKVKSVDTYLFGALLPDAGWMLNDVRYMDVKCDIHHYIEDYPFVYACPGEFITRNIDIINSDVCKGYLTHLYLDKVYNMFWNILLTEDGKLMLDGKEITLKKAVILKYNSAYSYANKIGDVSINRENISTLVLPHEIEEYVSDFCDDDIAKIVDIGYDAGKPKGRVIMSSEMWATVFVSASIEFGKAYMCIDSVNKD